MRVNRARLAWAAATVGIGPLGVGALARPRLELTWRTAMAEANLQRVASYGRSTWTRSTAYDRLDPSEKRAVSYFLGMTSARLSTDALLGITHLAHLDPLLKATGHSLTGSRPDFVGYHPALPSHCVIVEAKGRTGAFSQAALDSAKKQAKKLPSINGAGVAIAVASEAYFGDGTWTAHLEDPPRVKTLARGFDPGLVVGSYYAPILRAITEVEELDGRQRSENGNYFPEAGLRISVPEFIREPMLAALTADVDVDKLSTAGASIIAGWPAYLSPSALAERRDAEDEGDTVWDALDGLRVEVDSVWGIRAGEEAPSFEER